MNPSPSSPIITAILAGGQARRFGGKDKGEILIEGQRLVDIICRRLVEQGSKIIISGRHDYGLGLDVVTDADDAPGGPVGGIYSIWKTLEGRELEGFFTVPVDGPNLPNDLLTSLYSKNYSTIAADEEGRHPTYGWWRMTDLSRVWEIAAQSKSVSLNKLADLIDVKVVNWEGGTAFTNINTPDDLAGM